MATIGTFKKTGSNEFTGEIVTLNLQSKGVRIVPDLRASGENAPSHRILVGRAEIGAAWSKRSNEGRDYLGLKLDDPSFTAPIYANLFDDEDGEGYSLIWSRPTVAAATEATKQGPGRTAGAAFPLKTPPQVLVPCPPIVPARPKAHFPVLLRNRPAESCAHQQLRIDPANQPVRTGVTQTSSKVFRLAERGKDD